MRRARLLSIMGCTAALVALTAGCASNTTPPANVPLADSTRSNALSAMHGEAMAHAKYLAYATQAQQAGRSQVARCSPPPPRPSTWIILRAKPI